MVLCYLNKLKIIRAIFKIAFLYVVLLLIPGQEVKAQDSFSFNPGNFTIGYWKDFKQSALSITFDDGTESQYYGAMPIMDSLKISGTFYLACNITDTNTWRYLNSEAKKGHEIGSHTLSHRVLTSANDEEILFELSESKRIILEKIPNQNEPFTFCYPGGYTNNHIQQLVSKFYIAARSVRKGINIDTTNIFALKAQWVLSRTSNKRLRLYLESLLNTKSWMIEMYHGFDNNGWSPIPLSVFKQHMEEISRLRDILWVAPVRDIVKYKLERNNSVITIDTCSDNSVSFYLNDYLNDSIFNSSLSLKVLVPLEWGNVAVNQGNNRLENKIIQQDNNNYVTFNAMPDNKLITIESISLKEDNSFNYFAKVYPVPFNEQLFIDLISHHTGFIEISIYDALGVQRVAERYPVYVGMNNIALNVSALNHGYYSLSIRLKDKNITIIEKVKILK